MIWISIPDSLSSAGAPESRVASLQLAIQDFLNDRGCTDLLVHVRPSASNVLIFYVSLKHVASRRTVEISGEDMDALMVSLPLKVSCQELLSAALQMESALCV